MEVNRSLVVLTVSVAARHKLDHLDLAVDPLGSRIRDPVLYIGQKVGKVPLQCLSGRDQRRKPRMRCPEVPRLEVFLRAFRIRVCPEPMSLT